MVDRVRLLLWEVDRRVSQPDQFERADKPHWVHPRRTHVTGVRSNTGSLGELSQGERSQCAVCPGLPHEFDGGADRLRQHGPLVPPQVASHEAVQQDSEGSAILGCHVDIAIRQLQEVVTEPGEQTPWSRPAGEGERKRARSGRHRRRNADTRETTDADVTTHSCRFLRLEPAAHFPALRGLSWSPGCLGRCSSTRPRPTAARRVRSRSASGPERRAGRIVGDTSAVFRPRGLRPHHDSPSYCDSASLSGSARGRILEPRSKGCTP